MNSIKSFIKTDFVILMLLIMTFVNPFFYGSRIALALTVVIFFSLKKYINCFDKNLFLIFFFSIFYEIIKVLKIEFEFIGFSSILGNILAPASLYLIGQKISKKCRNFDVLLFVLFILSLSFSIVPMISILLQIQENGFINGTRSLYLIWDKGSLRSATQFASFFVFNMAAIGLLNVKKKTKMEKLMSIAIVFLFVLSLICVLRLGSRTLILVGLISLLSSYLYNINKKSLLNVIFNLLIAFLGINYLVSIFDINSDVMYFFASRLNSDEYGVTNAGGRTERWISALNSIIEYPFGWKLSTFGGYAHNFWLDIARVAGIVPFIIMLKITFNSIKILLKSHNLLKGNEYVRSYFFICFLAFMLLFLVEPVMDGMFLLFLFYCFYVGFLKGISTNLNLVYHEN